MMCTKSLPVPAGDMTVSCKDLLMGLLDDEEGTCTYQCVPHSVYTERMCEQGWK